MVDRAALLVVDVQQGFDDAAHWGPRNNPQAEDNIRALLQRWRTRGDPVVLIQHDSTEPGSPLRPGQPGHDLYPWVEGPAALRVNKSVNSAFHGTPDLHAWLTEQGLRDLVVCGITTNHCCETTTRVAGNLGYRVRFALDATYTFDRAGPDGVMIDAETIARVSAASLHQEFAQVCATIEILG